ncbi:MAG TPA: putrescine aminotransferase [Bacillota bacterium]|jgi:putrescine aminotransferase|nr:putrescine aminotransferase [Clostridiales bacterium UBA9856]HQC81803.1 putrescine aminotransferase [Bacillota bacterium]
MAATKEVALQEAKRILSYIESKELTDEDKERITKDSIENFNNHVNPGWLVYRKSVSTDAACIEWTDTEEHFTDLYGNDFIDCLGGFGIYTCGHRNPEIVKYVKAQLDKYALHSQELVDPLRGYLAKLVSMITPGDLQYCFFTNGGAEAVEMALKLARLATGGRYYISTVGAFHGKSYGAISMGGKAAYREDYLPMIQHVQHVKYGDADAIETAIDNLVTVGETVAAVILEPIQGEAGVQIPPKGYLKRVREICDKYGVALILDEIQTGMGRTGTMWRCEAEDVVPDIMTFGKAFGGGVMPITGIVARPNMWVEKLVENPWILGSPTFGGNPLACAAAIATIKYMLENDIPKQCKEKGDYFMEKLNALMEKYPTVIKEVRGAGLLICLEFPASEVGYAVVKGLFDRHVMTAGTLVNAQSVRIEPPGIISYETIDTVLEKLEEAIIDVKKEFKL